MAKRTRAASAAAPPVPPTPRGPHLSIDLDRASKIVCSHLTEWLMDEQTANGWTEARWQLEPTWQGNQWRGVVVVSYTDSDGTPGERRHMIDELPEPDGTP